VDDAIWAGVPLHEFFLAAGALVSANSVLDFARFRANHRPVTTSRPPE
jgi:hypothetical protein